MNRQEAQIRELCAERGIKIECNGKAYELRGPGVSILVADLRLLRPADLKPWNLGEGVR